MIYIEVLEVPNAQTAKIPPKPTITNLLRHSRSEENLIEGEISCPVNSEKSLTVQCPPSSSSPRLPSTHSSSDLHSSNADCWSQEDDEISLQVKKENCSSRARISSEKLTFNIVCYLVSANEVEKTGQGYDIPDEC
jgi:hypothetical protein